MRKGTKIILGVAAGTAAVVGVGLLLNYLQKRELYGGYLDDDYEDDYEYDEDDYDYEEDLEDECCCVDDVKAAEASKEESTSEEIPVEKVMQEPQISGSSKQD